MKILFLLIPLSLLLLGMAVWGFFWMVKNRQFDQLDSAGWRILTDEAPAANPARKPGQGVSDRTDPGQIRRDE